MAGGGAFFKTDLQRDVTEGESETLTCVAITLRLQIPRKCFTGAQDSSTNIYKTAAPR